LERRGARGRAGDALAGFEALAGSGVEAADGSAADGEVGVADVAASPPAAFSNAFRCVRKSTSFARIAGSSGADAALAEAAGFAGFAVVDPAVPVAAVDPAPVVPAVPAIAPAASGELPSGPMSAFRSVSTFAYASFQLLWVVISSLKFEMS
jgi:hypothetical protein